jgi:flagellin FlaB
MRRVKKMRDLFKTLRKKDVGSIGIGAMIVFIAMVLVAGIAASVLIQTSARLETQAMSTGRETSEEVASGIAVYDVAGFCNDSDSGNGVDDLSKLAIGVRARAGSDGIDLSETFIELSDTNTKVVLNYTSAFYAEPDGQDDIFNKAVAVFPDDDWARNHANNTDATRFGILVIEDADNSLTQDTPVINRGDRVYLCINATGCFGNIGERTDVWGAVIPELGSPGVIGFVSPASYSVNIYDLQ